MADILQLLVAGLATGAIYALAAIGFTLLWQTSQTINFAQGEFVMMPAFLVLAGMTFFNLPFWLALIVGFVLSVLILGLMFKKLLVDPMIKHGVLPLVIATIALGLLLKESVKEFYSAEAQAFPPLAEDVTLLREQAQRCRDILGKITQLSSSGEPFDRLPLSGLIEEVVAPHRNFGIEIDVILPPDRQGEPIGARNAAILYGLGNLVENAVDFAQSRAEIAARWNDQEVVVTISDDGPGFAPEVLARIGEPYVTTRGGRKNEPEAGGLGLGFFIAKTLLERSGASVAFVNRSAPQSGAVVRVRWPRAEFDALAAAAAGDA